MKKILQILFPQFSIFNKNTLSQLAPLLDRLMWTLKIYSLTLVIPISVSAINILMVGILGIPSLHGFWENFYYIWIGYYFTGNFIGIIAYKWQLFLLAISFILTFSD